MDGNRGNEIFAVTYHEAKVMNHIATSALGIWHSHFSRSFKEVVVVKKVFNNF